MPETPPSERKSAAKPAKKKASPDAPASQRGGQESNRAGKPAKKKASPKDGKPKSKPTGQSLSPDAAPVEEEAEGADPLGDFRAETAAASEALKKEQEAAKKAEEEAQRRKSVARASAMSETAPYPPGARVFVQGAFGDNKLAYVLEFDHMNAVYKLAMGSPTNISGECPLVHESALRPASSAYPKGARIGVIRSSGQVSLAFVSGFVKGLYEVALGHPDSEDCKMAREQDLRPADSGYEVGARVLVTRSSGEETLAFVSEFDSSKGLYKLALGSLDSAEIKVAREKDIRKEPAAQAAPVPAAPERPSGPSRVVSGGDLLMDAETAKAIEKEKAAAPVEVSEPAPPSPPPKPITISQPAPAEPDDDAMYGDAFGGDTDRNAAPPAPKPKAPVAPPPPVVEEEPEPEPEPVVEPPPPEPAPPEAPIEFELPPEPVAEPPPPEPEPVVPEPAAEPAAEGGAPAPKKMSMKDRMAAFNNQ